MAKTTWRIAFAGAPAFGATILKGVIDSPHRVEQVYTQPDRRAGRGRKLTASPVRTLAEAAGIAVHTPTRLAGKEQLALAAIDVFVVAAYGLLLPPAILNAPKLGCLNVHASLLPRWRGAAPVERAIMAGDSETGVSIMRMDAGLDTGPVYCRHAMTLGASANGTRSHRRLSDPWDAGATRYAGRAARLSTGATRRQAGHLRTEAHGSRLPHRLAAFGHRHRSPNTRLVWARRGLRHARPCTLAHSGRASAAGQPLGQCAGPGHEARQALASRLRRGRAGNTHRATRPRARARHKPCRAPPTATRGCCSTGCA